jgi:hypothetical protein
METLQRLILIVTLTGLISNPWLGAIERPATPIQPADVIPDAAITLISAAPAAALAAAPAAVSAAAPADEAVPQSPPARRGGGMGKALKK